MGAGYSRVFSLSENLYAQGSPIVIKAGALLKENESGSLVAQLKLYNLSSKTVKFVRVEITLLDSVGRLLDSPVLFDYLDVSAARGEDFGSQTPINIASNTARSYTVKVVEVGFIDNTVWCDNQNKWEQLPPQKLLTSVYSNDEAIMGYKELFGQRAEMVFCEHKDLWFCTCGAINRNDELTCCKCSASRTALQNADAQTLANEGKYANACRMAESNDTNELQNAIQVFEKIKDYKDSAQKLIGCKVKVNTIQSEAELKQNKRKKSIKFAALVASGAILLALFAYFIVYPFVSYQTGNYAVYIKMYKVEEFEIPKGVTTVNHAAFENCYTLTSVTIPDSVTIIGDSAFYTCSNLTSVTIPDSVTTIGDSAFYNCSNLTSVTIPDSVITIGDWAFSSCDNLTSVTISNSITRIESSTFWGCAFESIEIPNSVTFIGDYAFCYCDNLTSVTIPDSVTTIGDKAFSDCTNLTSVTIGDSVTTIGSSAFYGCSNLTSVTIPDSVTTISYSAFSRCSNLTDVYYTGSKDEWNALGISTYDINYATIHYNYVSQK